MVTRSPSAHLGLAPSITCRQSASRARATRTIRTYGHLVSHSLSLATVPSRTRMSVTAGGSHFGTCSMRSSSRRHQRLLPTSRPPSMHSLLAACRRSRRHGQLQHSCSRTPYSRRQQRRSAVAWSCEHQRSNGRCRVDLCCYCAHAAQRGGSREWGWRCLQCGITSG